MKLILVTGDDYKTLISKGLTFGKKTVFMCGKSLDREKMTYSNFFFHRCDEDTEFIIFDDCDYNIIDHSIGILTREYITVEKRGKDPFNISPDIIVNMNKENFYKCMKESKYLESLKKLGKLELFLI